MPVLDLIDGQQQQIDNSAHAPLSRQTCSALSTVRSAHGPSAPMVASGAGAGDAPRAPSGRPVHGACRLNTGLHKRTRPTYALVSSRSQARIQTCISPTSRGPSVVSRVIFAAGISAGSTTYPLSALIPFQEPSTVTNSPLADRISVPICSKSKPPKRDSATSMFESSPLPPAVAMTCPSTSLRTDSTTPKLTPSQALASNRFPPPDDDSL